MYLISVINFEVIKRDILRIPPWFFESLAPFVDFSFLVFCLLSFVDAQNLLATSLSHKSNDLLGKDIL